MTTTRYLYLGVGVVAFLTTGIVGQAQSSSSQSAATRDSSPVPRAVPFNGQALLPNGEARTGTALLTFGLYTDQKDGAPLWTEQHLVTLDANGRYAVVLGSASAEGLPVDAFNANTPKWLGVTVEAEPEQPRVVLLSVPYALKAADADTIGGRPASEFVVRANLFDTVKSTLKAEGYAPRPSNPTTSVPGVLAVFTDASNSLGNSNVVQNGSNIGINVSPAYPLHVFGATGGPFGYQTLRLDNPHLAGSSFTLGPTFPGAHVYSILSSGPASALGAGSLGVYDEGVGQFRLVIAPNGNVGIGTSTPLARLDARGDVFVGLTSVPDIAGSPGSSVYVANDSGDARNSFRLDGYNDNLFLVARSGAASPLGAGIRFRTADAGQGEIDRMIITPAGNVGIGITNPLGRLEVVNANAGNCSVVAVRLGSLAGGIPCQGALVVTVDDPSSYLIHGARPGVGTIFRVNGSGDVLVAGNVTPLASDGTQNLGSPANRWAAVYAANGTIQTSDAGLKHAVANLAYGLGQVLQLRPITFLWNDQDDRRTHIGLIAQEVDRVIPEAVEHPSREDEPLGLNYSSLVPVLIKAIQEQQAVIAEKSGAVMTLQTENAALKEETMALDARVAAIEHALQQMISRQPGLPSSPRQP